MKSSEKHLQELNEIRNLMEKSSRFLSLSGLSGISAGLAALAGGLAAWIFMRSGDIPYDELYNAAGKVKEVNLLLFLIADSILVLLFATGAGFYFSFKRAGKMQLPFWNPASKRMLTNLLIPLLTGGLVCMILLFRGSMNMIAPLTLIFYGLALINAGKYTQYNIHYLGITEILTGLAAMIFIQYGWYFWLLGFGIWHILYGSIFYFKFEREER